MMRYLIPAQINALGEDQVDVVMSTAALARDEHILVPQGCVLENYRSNPIVLWSHDPDKPIGNAETIDVGVQRISARVRFAPLGISHKADEIRGLTKAGVIRAVSVGFDPLDMQPLDPKKPRAGQRITKWELLELSFVSVPADVGALVTARSGRGGKVLSGQNASALQEAHDLAERCRSTLAGVLDGAGELGSDHERRLRQVDVMRLSDPMAGETEFERRQREVAERAGSGAGHLTLEQRQRDLRRLSRGSR